MSEMGCWWEADEDSTHEAVFEYVVALEESQKYIHELNLRNGRLYANCDLMGLDWSRKDRDYSRRPQGHVTENVIMSVCDTATALIAKNRPRAKLLTDHGEFTDQRKARLLEQFLEGCFQSTSIYKEAVKVFRDAVVFGTGALHVWGEHGRTNCRRVLIDELIVDEAESISTPPRQMHWRRRCDKEVLKAQFPDHSEAIENAHSTYESRRHTSYQTVEPHQVIVVESWHLRSGPGAGDGRYACCIQGATLDHKVWNKPRFPFVWYRWSDPLTGFYGQGLAEQLTGIQLRINRLNRFIEEAQDLIAVPRIFLPVGAKVSAPQITNDVGAIIPYRGARPPTFMTPTAVTPEIYQYKEQLKQSAYQLAGISMMSAQSVKPAGLESAVALREHTDIESARFAIPSQAFEEMFMDAAYAMIDVARDLNKRKRFTSVFRAPTFIKKIDWADVDMDADRFQVSIEASSILSKTPSGRLQNVIELNQAGMVDKDEGRRLLGHPDLARSQDIATAGIEDIEAALEEHLDGTTNPPEPYQNLVLGLKRFQAGYLKARRDGAPEEILEGLRNWIDMAEQLLEESMQPPPGAPAPVEGVPATPSPMPGAEVPGPLPAAPMPPV